MARSEYVITLVKSGDKKLGIQYDDSDGVTLVIKNIQPGLIWDWICSQPSNVWVHLDDAIIEVNGVSGSSELLEEECKKSQTLTVKLRPRAQAPNEPKACLSDSTEVYVHVYDLWGEKRAISRTLNTMSTRYGLYHTGVEVFGREWSFCGHDSVFHGVYCMPEPKKHPLHKYRRSICMGNTALSPADFESLIPLLRLKWPAWCYHLAKRNCHHFTDFMCRALGFPAGPRCGIFGAGDSRLFGRSSKNSLPFFGRRGCLGCCRPRRDTAAEGALLNGEMANIHHQDEIIDEIHTRRREEQVLNIEPAISDPLAAALIAEKPQPSPSRTVRQLNFGSIEAGSSFTSSLLLYSGATSTAQPQPVTTCGEATLFASTEAREPPFLEGSCGEKPVNVEICAEQHLMKTSI